MSLVSRVHYQMAPPSSAFVGVSTNHHKKNPFDDRYIAFTSSTKSPEVLDAGVKQRRHHAAQQQSSSAARISAAQPALTSSRTANGISKAPGAAAAAVTEVTAAVDDLHAHLEILKAMKAQLLKQTAAAAKASNSKTAKQSGKKCKETAAAEPLGLNNSSRGPENKQHGDASSDSDDTDSDEVGTTVDGHNNRPVAATETWQLFEALTVQDSSVTQQQRQQQSQPAPPGSPEQLQGQTDRQQQHLFGLHQVAADSCWSKAANPLQQLIQQLLPAVYATSTAAANSSSKTHQAAASATAAANEGAVAAAPAPGVDMDLFLQELHPRGWPLLPDISSLLQQYLQHSTLQSHTVASTAADCGCAATEAGGISSNLAAGVFDVAPYLARFEQQQQQQQQQQLGSQPTAAAPAPDAGLIAGRFTLVSAAEQFDSLSYPYGDGSRPCSQGGTAAAAGTARVAAAVAAAEDDWDEDADLPSYLQAIMQHQQQQQQKLREKNQLSMQQQQQQMATPAAAAISAGLAANLGTAGNKHQQVLTEPVTACPSTLAAAAAVSVGAGDLTTQPAPGCVSCTPYTAQPDAAATAEDASPDAAVGHEASSTDIAVTTAAPAAAAPAAAAAADDDEEVMEWVCGSPGAVLLDSAPDTTAPSPAAVQSNTAAAAAAAASPAAAHSTTTAAAAAAAATAAAEAKPAAKQQQATPFSGLQLLQELAGDQGLEYVQVLGLEDDGGFEDTMDLQRQQQEIGQRPEFLVSTSQDELVLNPGSPPSPPAATAGVAAAEPSSSASPCHTDADMPDAAAPAAAATAPTTAAAASEFADIFHMDVDIDIVGLDDLDGAVDEVAAAAANESGAEGSVVATGDHQKHDNEVTQTAGPAALRLPALLSRQRRKPSSLLMPASQQQQHAGGAAAAAGSQPHSNFHPAAAIAADVQTQISSPQQEQQKHAGSQKAKYVPRFAKRQQRYQLLASTLQQQQQQQAPEGAAEDEDTLSVAAAAFDNLEAAAADMIIDDDQIGAAGGLGKTPAAAAAMGAKGSSSLFDQLALEPTQVAQQQQQQQQQRVVPVLGRSQRRRLSSISKGCLDLQPTPKDGSNSQLATSHAAAAADSQGPAAAAAAAAAAGDDDEIEDGSSSEEEDAAAAAQGGYPGTVPVIGRRKAPATRLGSQIAAALPECPAADTVDRECDGPPDAAAAARGQGGSSSSSDWDSLDDDDDDAFVTSRRSATTTMIPQQQQQQQQRVQQQTGVTSSQPSAAAAAAAAAVHRTSKVFRGPGSSLGPQQQQQPALLLPAFKRTTAWQFSSSNLLRVCQSGLGGSKARFKPVAKPDGLLKKPKVPLDQLGVNVTSLQLPMEGSAGAALLQALLGDQYEVFQHRWQQLLPPPPAPAPHPQWQTWDQWHQQQQQQQQRAGVNQPQPQQQQHQQQQLEDECDDIDWDEIDALEQQHTNTNVATAAAAATPGKPGLTSAAVQLNTPQHAQQQQQQQHEGKVIDLGDDAGQLVITGLCDDLPQQQQQWWQQQQVVQAPGAWPGQVWPPQQQQQQWQQHWPTAAGPEPRCVPPNQQQQPVPAATLVTDPAAAAAAAAGSSDAFDIDWEGFAGDVELVMDDHADAIAAAAAGEGPAAAAEVHPCQKRLVITGLEDDGSPVMPAAAAAAAGNTWQQQQQASSALQSDVACLNPTAALGWQTGTPWYSQQQQVSEPAAAAGGSSIIGLSQLQLLQQDLEDLTCQLVFMDEEMLFDQQQGQQQQQQQEQQQQRDLGDQETDQMDLQLDCTTAAAATLPCTADMGPTPATAAAAGAAAGWSRGSQHIEGSLDSLRLSVDSQAAAAAAGADLEAATAAAAMAHPSTTHIDPEHISPAAAAAPAAMPDDTGPEALAAAAADGPQQQQQQQTGKPLFGWRKGFYHGNSTAAAALAQMGPQQRQAWVAAARQRQQQLYGQFIQLALQGQLQASAAGNCGLQQLMKLVAECVKEAAREAAAAAAAGSDPAAVAAAKGTDGAKPRMLDIMGLINRVQQKHREMVVQQHAAKTGRALPSKAPGSAPCPVAAAVAPQRLFFALLNVAHQNNMAVQGQGMGKGADPTAAAAAADGKEPCSSRASVQQGGTAVAWVPDVKICFSSCATAL